MKIPVVKFLLLSLIIIFCIFDAAAQRIADCNGIVPGCRPGYHRVELNDVGDFNCVKFSDVAGTWEEMEDFCSRDGAVLLDVPNVVFFENLITKIIQRKNSADGYWIGGSDRKYEGHFQWLSGDGVKMGTPFWGDDDDDVQDPDGGTEEDCIFMAASDHYYFTDRDCTENHRAICSQISSRFYKMMSNLCIQFESHFKGTWNEAKEYCQKTPRAKMLELKDVSLMHEVVKQINDLRIPSQGDGFWIGGQQRYHKFHWGDTWNVVPLGTPFWGRDTDDVQDPDGGPSGNCILMSKKDFYFFADRNCNDNVNETHSVLCSVHL